MVKYILSTMLRESKKMFKDICIKLQSNEVESEVNVILMEMSV